MKMRTAAARFVAILALPGFEAVDVVGPFEVFSAANRLLEQQGAPAAYRLSVVSKHRGALRTASGLVLSADRGMREPLGELDTLIVTGALDYDERDVSTGEVEWVVAHAARARRVVSICTGAFVLARAGLLTGKRATTHWLKAGALAARYPEIEVQGDAIFIRDGDVWTSAGATAGMDLALSLVGDDLGREVARTVAQLLVIFVQRPGGQSQFSAAMLQSASDDHRIGDVQMFVLEHPEADLRAATLAKRAGMSPRNFARVFKAQTGSSPAVFVARARLEAARRLLEEASPNIDEVARAAGFGSTETMRRSFQRSLGVSPRRYREGFGSAA